MNRETRVSGYCRGVIASQSAVCPPDVSDYVEANLVLRVLRRVGLRRRRCRRVHLR